MGRLHHNRGGGLFIWGDNAPLFAHSNALLAKLFKGMGIEQVNDHQGGQIMKAGTSPTTPGQFRTDHVIMTGIQSLFEGTTICHLKNVGPLKILATYNSGSGYTGQPYCAIADAEVYGKCPPDPDMVKVGRGHVAIDGGFTKLYDQYFEKTTGTARYVKNVSTWLVNIGSRLKSEGVP